MGTYTNQQSTFCWLDLATTDPEGAKNFYSQIFGWEIMDIPVGENMIYTMLNLKGLPVAALSDMPPDMKAMNMPPFWSSYIAVNDINEIVSVAVQNGGTVVVPAMQVMEEGYMAVLQDPDGAYLGLWQAINMKGFAFKDEAGAVCWFEEGCRSRDNVIPFYEKTFGWKSETTPMGNNLYTVFSLGETMVAGLYEMGAEMVGVPSHWLPYMGVSNLDLTLEKTTELGGKILMPKLFVENVGAFSVIQDPQGGAIGLLEVPNMQ